MAINWSECTECYAVPGEGNIIDMINPKTGLTCINGNTEAEIKLREPSAVRMAFVDWQKARAVIQRRPWTWQPTTERQYNEMLEVLPPIDWDGTSFLVGEPDHHMADTGEPTYQAYRQRGSSPDYVHYERSSRAITRRELREGKYKP